MCSPTLGCYSVLCVPDYLTGVLSTCGIILQQWDIGPVPGPINVGLIVLTHTSLEGTQPSGSHSFGK